MTHNKTILVTRPKKQAEELSGVLKAKGYNVLVDPMLSIEPRNFEAPAINRYDAFIFTSRNALDIFSEKSADRDTSVLIVGERSTQKAREIGYKNVKCVGDNVRALNEYLSAHRDTFSKSLLYVRAADISKDVTGNNVTIEELIVYDATQAKAFKPNTISAFEGRGVDCVLFYSRRTAQNFMDVFKRVLPPEALSDTKALCISPSVLECVQDYPWAGAYASDRPDQEAIIDKLGDL